LNRFVSSRNERTTEYDEFQKFFYHPISKLWFRIQREVKKFRACSLLPDRGGGLAGRTKGERASKAIAVPPVARVRPPFWYAGCVIQSKT